MPLDPRYTLAALDTIGSTNDEAKRLARQSDAPTLTLVWARRQSAGRGRLERRWMSPEGNLYWSCVVRLPLVGGQVAPVTGDLCFAAAAAVVATVRRLAPEVADLAVKWPNDVLIGGAKTAGILVEADNGAAPFAVVGIGVNVGWAPDDTPYPATCLAAHGGTTDVARAFDALSAAFLHYHDLLITAGPAAVRADLEGLWARLGERIEVRAGAEPLVGVFEGLDGHGRLCLRLDDGRRRTVTVGDVFFV
ncbi:BirA family biotin operon repressor/biotin-[acetyl-CoA-carboxylase] ligase [Rhodothalassium salexigens DSM 2132]|uniref:biotin--[biotin carboxyl-carrier protein] ligase n=1 Tax=Rhodothalassium salexigens DSM 2132 TaxID=1188247 RepID=A0A4R2PSK2_RHOSA|nr:biotin--[acetyl-CoA-carboxylase] ligase [Rhodothalassium salexigens]MBB4210505.1 BirA family biotin operon repressor/biotin-[acetyl-CoA-carboxylase] ligase [Rhodothalassium salexigens DSM 2132]MBK1639884.1 biotin--[acetyl-CoA-carboxylase] ligase [Rhodothalassium salexigens DSM 2132]TCP37938.1 BirA family biotin operon repressor/biotin-[acetyl-CoA-carboxylase] ligase [Rhodothalassium salexigens DSM 2132]